MPLKIRRMLIKACLYELKEKGWQLDEAVLRARLALRQQKVENSEEMRLRKAAANYTVDLATRLGLAA